MSNAFSIFGARISRPTFFEGREELFCRYPNQDANHEFCC